MESDHATHVSSSDLVVAPLSNQLSKFMLRDSVSLPNEHKNQANKSEPEVL